MKKKKQLIDLENNRMGLFMSDNSFDLDVFALIFGVFKTFLGVICYILPSCNFQFLQIEAD